ncbi:hypothetical protein PVL29_009399 [Vitis rotundifolia]|uniref:Uncharacterized protein n=1 Tax=Vitis rotundifolia TaxID=103349 RepID=A0AA39DUL9_VITRO|nr:hypothetical protein PVL29_009399 [Vitis rotundifolia]
MIQTVFSDFGLGRCWVCCQWLFAVEKFGCLVQALTCNCLTKRESTLVIIHLSRCHTIFSSRMPYIFTLFLSVGTRTIQTSRGCLPFLPYF